MQRTFFALLFAGLLAACGDGPTQSEECKKMIACANALEAGSGDSAYDATYGAAGSCWLTDGAAEQCTKTCKSMLEDYAKRDGAPDACK